MGRYIKGILGGFSGKVGNIVGGKWKGIHYMRSLSETRNDAPTEKQVIHRAKFAFASKFLQPLQPVLKVGYRTQNTKQSPQNAAMSDLMHNAIEGDYPAFRINPVKLRIAKGSLIVANDYQVAIEGNEIRFSWQDNPQITLSHGSNMVIMVAIGEGIYPTYSYMDFVRNSMTGLLPLPSGPSGSEIFCYLAFANEVKNKEVSNSKLVGSVILP